MYRILFVDHTPFAGGGQLVLIPHIRELDSSLWQVHLACTNDAPELIDQYSAAGATVHVLNMPRLRGSRLQGLVGLFRAARSLRRLVSQQQIDLVVANTSRTSYIATIALLATSVPLIWWVRDNLYSVWLFKFLRWRTAKIICVSEFIKRWYMSADDPGGTVLYVASNMHQRLAQVDADIVDQERQKYGLLPSDFVLGYMGRLVVDKGPQDVIEAVARLSPNYPQLKLLVVGSGQGQEGDNEAQLHHLVKEHQLSTVVHLTGYQANQPVYYRLMSAFVLSTRLAEAYATSVVEAMMAGLPVIASRTGGTPELVKDGQTGLLYQPGDVDGLVAALQRIMEDAELVQRLAQAGLTQVLQCNQEDQLAQAAQRLYLQAIERN